MNEGQQLTSGDTVYLTDGWFEENSAGSVNFDSTSIVGSDSLYIGGCYTPIRSYTWSYPVYTRIRLKLSEIEHLRKRCRDDHKLKMIMRKFAPHIEVEVDFP